MQRAVILSVDLLCLLRGYWLRKSLLLALSFWALLGPLASVSWASVERGFVEAPKGACARLLHKGAFTLKSFEPTNLGTYRDRLAYILDQIFLQSPADPYLAHFARASGSWMGLEAWPSLRLQRGPMDYQVIFRVVPLEDSQPGYGVEMLAQMVHEGMKAQDLDFLLRRLYPLQNYRVRLWEEPLWPMERQFNRLLVQALMAESKPSGEQIQALTAELRDNLQLLVTRADIVLRERWFTYLMTRFNSYQSPFWIDELKFSRLSGWAEDHDQSLEFKAFDIRFRVKESEALQRLNQLTQVKDRVPVSVFRLLVFLEADLSGGPGLQLYLLPARRDLAVRAEDSRILRLDFNSMDLASDVYLQIMKLNWAEGLEDGLTAGDIESHWADSLNRSFSALQALPPQPLREGQLLLGELMWSLVDPSPNPWEERGRLLESLDLSR